MSTKSGRATTPLRATVAPGLVVVVVHDPLSDQERSLVEGGAATGVLELRHDEQESVQADLIREVEEAVGRRVIAFTSANHVDPDIGVETFVLEG